MSMCLCALELFFLHFQYTRSATPQTLMGTCIPCNVYETTSLWHYCAKFLTEWIWGGAGEHITLHMESNAASLEAAVLHRHPHPAVSGAARYATVKSDPDSQSQRQDHTIICQWYVAEGWTWQCKWKDWDSGSLLVLWDVQITTEKRYKTWMSGSRVMCRNINYINLKKEDRCKRMWERKR